MRHELLERKRISKTISAKKSEIFLAHELSSMNRQKLLEEKKKELERLNNMIGGMNKNNSMQYFNIKKKYIELRKKIIL